MSLERKRPARPVGMWLEVWGSLTPKAEGKRETVKAEKPAPAKKAPAKKAAKKASK